MPVTYELDYDRKLIRTRCFGNVTLPEVLGHFDELQALTDRPEQLDVLLDLSEATSLPETQQLRAVASRVEAMGRSAFRAIAVVASSDAMYGMLRMFGAFAGAHFERIGVFRNLEDAQAELAAGGAAHA